MSGRQATLAAALVAAALPLGSCGTSSASKTVNQPNVAAVSPTVERARMASADCNLWRVLDLSAQKRLLADFRAFFGGRIDAASTSGLRGAALSDARAQRLFTSYCRLPFAAAFKLYKLYGRSAALTGR